MATGSSFTFALKPDQIPFATTGLEAPVFYAEVIRGTVVGRHCIKLNLIDNRLDVVDQKLKAVHVATLVIPADRVRQWAKTLNGIAQDLDKPGSEDAG
jgi:hypothetical protein